jgi:hypothetical protein
MHEITCVYVSIKIQITFQHNTNMVYTVKTNIDMVINMDTVSIASQKTLHCVQSRLSSHVDEITEDH